MLKIARPSSRTTRVVLPQRFLQGDGIRVDLTGTMFINKAGITSSTFKTIPDVPVNNFELFLPEGRYFAVEASGNLCKTQANPTKNKPVQNPGVYPSQRRDK